MAIKHIKTATKTDCPCFCVGTSEWNDCHEITGNVNFMCNDITNVCDVTSITNINGVAIANYAVTCRANTYDVLRKQTFHSGQIVIRNPNDTFEHILVIPNSGLNRTITFPDAGATLATRAGNTFLNDQNFSGNDLISVGNLLTDDGYIELGDIAPPCAPAACMGRLFMNACNCDHISFRRNTGCTVDLESGGGGDLTVRIPLTMEVPQGTVAFPDVHSLVTGVAKVSGMVLPDGATLSTVNFKANVPDNLASTPAASLKFYIMTQGAVCPSGDLRLTVSSIARADGENMDIAEACWQTESETTVAMPTATETLDIYCQDMTTDPAAGDILMVQIVRDPTDCLDDFTDDVIVVGAYLEIDITPA